MLVREGVPYQVVGGVRFYTGRDQDAMAYLSVISNPDDSVSLERIINVPKRGLSKHIGRLGSRITRAGRGSRCTQRSRRPTRPALRVPQESLPGVLDLFGG